MVAVPLPLEATCAGLDASSLVGERLRAFQRHILQQGDELYRDLPWRNIEDPYAVLVSEVMLQQTQVVRVLGKWTAWLDVFPTVDALAAAPLSVVLERWQGLGYNRRALALKRAADICVDSYGGELPSAYDDLLRLPGIGPATAAGVRVFAFQEPEMYLETNVRAVFLHEFFPDAEKVPDSQLVPLVEAAVLPDDPRRWYYALLDYGVYLKGVLPNPSRRSKHHVRQSAFEGSHRQKRAELLRLLLAGPLTSAEAGEALSELEQQAGRPPVESSEVELILRELAAEGFLSAASVHGELQVR